MPWLSILVPTLNRAPYLEITLEALYKQTKDIPREEVEIIVDDNASTDNTEEVCRKYDRFIYIKNPCTTPFLQRMERTTGEYLWIICDDDFVDENAIPIILNFIKKSHEEKPVFLINVAQVDKTGEKLLSAGVCDFGTQPLFKELADFLPVNGSFDILGFYPAFAFPREQFLKAHIELFFALGSGYDFVGPFLEAFYHNPAVFVGMPLITQRLGNQRYDGPPEEATYRASLQTFAATLKLFILLEERFNIPMTQTLQMKFRARSETGAPCISVLNYALNCSLKPTLLKIPDQLEPAVLQSILEMVARVPDFTAASRANTLIRCAHAVAEIRQVIYGT